MEYKYTGNHHEIKEEEWLIEEEGLKLNFSNCKAADLVVDFSGYELPGWIIIGDIEVLVDAVSHTKKGAIGKVIHSSLNHCLIVDGEHSLAKQIDFGASSPISDAQKASFDELLEHYDSKLNCGRNIKSDFLDDTKWRLFLLSHKEVFIITKKALVIANGVDKEVFVRYSDDTNSAHVFVNKGSVNIRAGNCDIEVNEDGNEVIINGKNVKEMVTDIISELKSSLSFSF